MALSFKEIRTCQKEISSNLDKLEAGGLSFKEIRELQRRNEELFSILEGTTPEKTEPTLGDQLIAGKFDQKNWMEYIDILNKVKEENSITVIQMQDCIERFFMANENEIRWEEIAESDTDTKNIVA